MEKLIKVSEAAKMIGVSVPTVRTLIDRGVLTADRSGVLKVYLQDVMEYIEGANRKKIVSPFGMVTFEPDESAKPLDPLNVTKDANNLLRFWSDNRYLVTNHGRVFNMTRGALVPLEATPATHGYLQINLKHGRKSKPVRLHRVVAYVWCPNGKLKSDVHHINGDRTDNSAVNLIFMTDDEHREAHRLLNEAEKTNNYVDYYIFIEKVRKDNEEKHPIHWLYISDIEGFEMDRGGALTREIHSDSGLQYFIVVNDEGYTTFKKNGTVKGNDIICFSAINPKEPFSQ